jgi:hypothetical protein
MNKPKNKLFIIRKYVMARSAVEAIKLDKSTPVDDVWIDDDWKNSQRQNLETAIGFSITKNEQPQDEDS